MSETQRNENAKEENPSEIHPDVEPEEIIEPEDTPNPEETVEQTGRSPIQESTVSRSNSLNLSKSQQEENPSEPLPDVHTAAEPGQAVDSEEVEETEETSPLQVVTSSTNAALSIEDLEAETSTLVHFSESLFRTKQCDDKFTQTFFKYMKNLSDRSCVKILNTEVDHEDKSLVFYRKSFELLQFVDVEKSRCQLIISSENLSFNSAPTFLPALKMARAIPKLKKWILLKGLWPHL